MKQIKNVNMGAILWIIIMLVFGNIGFVSRLFTTGPVSEPVTEDTYMTTGGYHTDIQVNEDNSYSIKEDINVSFDTARHGIYRYIPYKGVITEAEKNGELTDVPYYASVKDVTASEYVTVNSENGNKVLRLGDEDETVYGEHSYKLSYKAAPVTNKGYGNVYWNIYPTGWRNEIPAGSSFSITFPKDFDHDSLVLYYGSYGEQRDAMDIVQLDWNGNTVTGILNEALPVSNGMTVYVPMENGYFTGMATVTGFNLLIIGISVAVLLLLIVLFLVFGRDEQIIPSVQFQPLQGLDSAAVGYIIDGNISDVDLVSLFIFWADRGFIKIRETKDKTMAFTKLKSLPEDSPAHAAVLFNEVFGEGPDSIGKEVLVSDMKYRTASVFEQAKLLLKKEYKNLYTRQSRVARGIASVLSVIPLLAFTVLLMKVTFANIVVVLFAVLYFVGLLLFSHTVDFWYSRARRGQRVWGSVSSAFCVVPFMILIALYGVRMIKGDDLNLFPALLGVSIVSVSAMVLTGFMKKRTSQCVEWMGYLAGLRDFIETAELERMQAIAKDSPQLFYHILPFAYVFGLSDILLDKMKDLTLPAPEWYETRSQSPFFDYYLMHYMFHSNMMSMAQTMATPEPPAPSRSSDGGSFGGGFGGGFSGGGFSGGGFGGGGGGSW